MSSVSGDTGFFVDGLGIHEIKISRQIIRLIGLGDGNAFMGWGVLGVTDLAPEYSYGRQIKALAFGSVTGTDNGASITYQAFDIFRSKGKTTFSVTRNSTGYYTVSFQNLPLASNNYFVALTGTGNTKMKATLDARGVRCKFVLCKG